MEARFFTIREEFQIWKEEDYEPCGIGLEYFKFFKFKNNEIKITP